MNANSIVIVAACRTPIGALNGRFKNLQPVDLTTPVMRALVKRSAVAPSAIDDVIWGCNYQRTYLENNLARVAAVKSGLPDRVPGITVHRNCTSSMSAIQMAYYQLKAGEAGCLMAGGTDSMSTAPHVAFGMRGGVKFGEIPLRDSMWDSLTHLGIGPSMGMTAENVAERYGITRKEQDEYALLSQQRAAKAMVEGTFEKEIVPIEIAQKGGAETILKDEYPRDTTAEKLASLKPVFMVGGTVTAGNSSGMNDGSAGVVLTTMAQAQAWGIPPLALIVSTATIGVNPDFMGIGPIDASRLALEKAGLDIEDIGLFEINEAFASQCIACQRELGIPLEKLNVNGGAISLGHPVGATGARIVTHLLYEMARTGVRYGLASLCAGGGMGTAIILENPNWVDRPPTAC